MFANPLQRSEIKRYLVVGLVAVVASLAAMALSMPAAAGTHSHRVHGFAVAWPTKQVAPTVATRRLAGGLPASVDLRAYSVAVGDQGQVDSCVAWAIDYAMLGWYSRHDNRPGQPFNPMYTYSQIHSDDSAGGGGSRPSDALRLAQTQGNDTMAHYSRSSYDFTHLPSQSERANAANWRISGYQTLFALRTGGGRAGELQIKTALASGRPVAIALVVRKGFDELTGGVDTDIVSKIEGSHEVLAVGYDQSGLLIQNSWGTNWGSQGYGRLSWQLVEHDVFQAHTISGFAAAPTPTPTPPGPTPTPNDNTAPTMGAVTFQFLGARTATKAPARFSWSASDASGIAGYAVYISTDGSAYVQDTKVSTTAAQVSYDLAVGHSYQVAVRAVDPSGHWSPLAYSSYITVR
jgi:hypothetical protein